MTTRITVKNEVGRPLNPHTLYTDDPFLNYAYAKFEQSVKPYPCPGIPDTKEGEFVEAELVWQYRINRDLVEAGIHKELKWADCPNVEIVTAMPDMCRQIYRLAQQPKEQEKEKTAKELIADERERQISKEGWTIEHDDKHVNGELARAADCYYDYAEDNDYSDTKVPSHWPWEGKWWKPKNQLQDYIRAGALYKAELERLERAGGAAGPELTNIRIGIRQCEIRIDEILKHEAYATQQTTAKDARIAEIVEENERLKSLFRLILKEGNEVALDVRHIARHALNPPKPKP